MNGPLALLGKGVRLKAKLAQESLFTKSGGLEPIIYDFSKIQRTNYLFIIYKSQQR